MALVGHFYSGEVVEVADGEDASCADLGEKGHGVGDGFAEAREDVEEGEGAERACQAAADVGVESDYAAKAARVQGFGEGPHHSFCFRQRGRKFFSGGGAGASEGEGSAHTS